MIIFKLISLFFRLILELCLLSGILVAGKVYLTDDTGKADAIWMIAKEEVIKPGVNNFCEWSDED